MARPMVKNLRAEIGRIFIEYWISAHMKTPGEVQSPGKTSTANNQHFQVGIDRHAIPHDNMSPSKNQQLNPDKIGEIASVLPKNDYGQIRMFDFGGAP